MLYQKIEFSTISASHALAMPGLCGVCSAAASRNVCLLMRHFVCGRAEPSGIYDILFRGKGQTRDGGWFGAQCVCVVFFFYFLLPLFGRFTHTQHTEHFAACGRCACARNDMTSAARRRCDRARLRRTARCLGDVVVECAVRAREEVVWHKIQTLRRDEHRA